MFRISRQCGFALLGAEMVARRIPGRAHYVAIRALRQDAPGGRLLVAGPWATLLGEQALADVLVTYPRSWSGRLSTADTVRGFGGSC